MKGEVVVLEGLINVESNKYARRFYQLLINEGYSVAGDSRYTNSNSRVRLRCPKGHVVSMYPLNFIHHNRRCKVCAGVSKKSPKQFKDEVKNLGGGEFEVLEDYINTSTPILFRHNSCGYEWKIRPNDFIGGNRCPSCAGNIRKTPNQFSEEVRELTNNEYTVLGEYKKESSKVEIKHNQCGRVWEVTPNSFLCGTRCPRCSSSKGERLIDSLLRSLGVSFETQVKLDKCVNKTYLPFDFGVYVNDELTYLIEYQGRHHYEPVDFAGRGEEWAEREFERVKYNDNIKKDFCEMNNIPLVEIKYTLSDEEIKNILIILLDERKTINNGV